MNTNSREVCREIIKSTIPADLWAQNEVFSKEVKGFIKSHRILKHPLLAAMGGAQLGVEAMQKFHLEFRYTFASIFTDSLIQAQFLAQALEHRFGPLAKVSARFMLQYNILDELGFTPGGSAGGDYGGSPINAHYIQFDKTLEQLGVDWRQAAAYKPTDAAIGIKKTIEGTYGDYALLLGMLAVAETVFDSFAGVWSKNMAMRTSVDTKEGYHSIHVEHDGQSMDDLHSEDLWYVFRQAMDPSRYGEVKAKVSEYLDALAGFADTLAAAASAAA